MRRCLPPALEFRTSREAALNSLNISITRHGNNEIRIFNQPAGLLKKIFVPRVQYVKSAKDHNTGRSGFHGSAGLKNFFIKAPSSLRKKRRASNTPPYTAAPATITTARLIPKFKYSWW